VSPDPGRAFSRPSTAHLVKGRHMPVYTCTTNTEAIDRGTKSDLAAEITRIRGSMTKAYRQRSSEDIPGEGGWGAAWI